MCSKITAICYFCPAAQVPSQIPLKWALLVHLKLVKNAEQTDKVRMLPCSNKYARIKRIIMLRPWRFSKNPDIVSLSFGVTYTRMRLHEFRLNLTWFPASSPNMNIRNNYQCDIIKIKCGFWDTPRNPDESSSTSEFFIFSHLVWQLLRCLPWHSFCHHDWISWPSSLKRCELYV